MQEMRNEHFSYMLEGASDGLWDWDVIRGKFSYSARWKDLLGYSDEDGINDSPGWLMLIHPDDLEITLQLLRGHFAGRSQLLCLEHRLRHKDGTEHWVRSRGASQRDEQGNITRIVGWHTDITEHMQMEEMQQRQAAYVALRMDVNQALSERGDLHDLLLRACEAFKRHLSIKYVCIWTLDKQKEILETSVDPHNTPIDSTEYTCFPVGVYKMGRIVQERCSYLSNDILHDPEIQDKRWANLLGMRAFAGYPLLVDEEAMGVMALFASETISEETFEALALVANTIAQGIGRKRAEEQLETRVLQRTRELELLLQISRAVASTLELKPLFRTILTQLKTVVQYDEVSLISVQGNELVALDYQGVQSAEQMDKLVQLFAQSKPFQKIREQHKVVIVDDLQADSRFVSGYKRAIGKDVGEQRSEYMASRVHSWMGIPLLVQNRLIGVLTINHQQPGFYTTNHANLAFALANQAAIALENALLYEQAQTLAALQERQRLARELHDSVTQELYGISLGAHAALEALEVSSEEALASIEHVIRHADAAIVEMRDLLFELRPESFKSEGLVSALEKRANTLRTRYGLTVHLFVRDEVDLPAEIKHALHRIAQEALHNIVRHARARTITIRFEYMKDRRETLLEIADDGSGFDCTGTFPGHLGLQTMQERSARLGGRFTICSQPGKGTCISVSIPDYHTALAG